MEPEDWARYRPCLFLPRAEQACLGCNHVWCFGWSRHPLCSRSHLIPPTPSGQDQFPFPHSVILMGNSSFLTSLTHFLSFPEMYNWMILTVSNVPGQMLTFLLPVFLYRLDSFFKEVIFIFHPFNQNRMVSCWLRNKPQIPLGGISGSPPAHLFCTLAQPCKSSLPSIRHSSRYHLPQVPRVFLCVLTCIICIYVPGRPSSQASPSSQCNMCLAASYIFCLNIKRKYPFINTC